MKKILSLLIATGILCAPVAMQAQVETPLVPTIEPAHTTTPSTATSNAKVKKGIHKKSVKKTNKSGNGKAVKKNAKHNKKAVKKSPKTAIAPTPVVEKPAI